MTLSVASPEALAKIDPSIVEHTSQIRDVCPSNTCVHLAVSIFQRRHVLSLEPDIIFLPSSPTKAAHFTLAVCPEYMLLTAFGTIKQL